MAAARRGKVSTNDKISFDSAKPACNILLRKGGDTMAKKRKAAKKGKKKAKKK